MKPQRIQRKRTKGYDMQLASRAVNGLWCVSVCRPGKWGNPHKVGWCHICGAFHTQQEAVEEYREEIVTRGRSAFSEIREQLAGQNLACFCRLADPCHADVLLEIANS